MTVLLTRITPSLVHFFVVLFVFADPRSRVLPLFVAAHFQSPVFSGDSIEMVGQLFRGMGRILGEVLPRARVE